MNIHKNAVLTPRGREILIERLLRGERPMDVATSMGVSVSTVYKWQRRYRTEGFDGLRDRTSRPHNSPHRTPANIEARVVALRKDRRTFDRIVTEVGVSRSTVGRIRGWPMQTTQSSELIIRARFRKLIGGSRPREHAGTTFSACVGLAGW